MMGIFDKQERHYRDRIEPTFSALAPGDSVSSSDVRLFEMFGEQRTAAGAVVNPTTSMRNSAVFACVNLIAGAIAQLPLHVYERVDDSRRRADHDYWWLLNEQFNQAWAASAAWEFLVSQVLLRGDGIAYITRNRAGQATGVIPWPRDFVQILEQARTDPKQAPRLQYTFYADVGYFTVDQADVLHLPGFGYNGVCSMSVIQWGARNGIGIALQGDEHAGKFFSEGGKPEVAITATNKMTQAMQDDFRDAWVKKYGGLQGNRRIPLILTEGLDVKELTMSAVDQQLLESRQWQVIDIARAFGCPPHMIGETSKASSWGTGIEQMGIGFVKHTLGPHLKRFRDELNRKLFYTARYFVEHSVESLMAGDSKAQAEYFGKALGGPGAQGWMTVNEVRRTKNLPPVPGGDVLYRPSEAAKPAEDAAPTDTERKQEDDDSEAAAAGA
ncbi:nucleoid-structuring protein H-NS (plasmid) [Xanthomonas citri pv. aurantifolii]|nr:nucleoid-structuring protein H-NS [Xanthomonas citri pv. aurantifolii]AMV05060.1 nucleoid-structuring protein H-NS [Xanthomonas citri pv. aurantifolii]TBW92969.1 nucleoid-structuring protein H-NS [Xanthomonas citri pv. aurantifolii]TBX01169.1 nucleoid-structuring protein H-NS [Xanthomonas citri pv. aurantifolii]TBX02632.1 nucleoid-structuring protein H-NS [Xanthomonas citri pv. aurantifolii]